MWNKMYTLVACTCSSQIMNQYYCDGYNQSVSGCASFLYLDQIYVVTIDVVDTHPPTDNFPHSVLPISGLPAQLGCFATPCRWSKNCWVGGWPKIGLLFISLIAAALFSSNLPISCQFREFVSLFQCPTTFPFINLLRL